MMSVMNFFVITSAQRATLMQGGAGWGSGQVAINPRAIDSASPGVGLNLNDSAVGIDPGDVVSLAGKYVAPKRIVDDPDYQEFAADMVAFLLELPFCTLETETIFVPDVI